MKESTALDWPNGTWSIDSGCKWCGRVFIGYKNSTSCKECQGNLNAAGGMPQQIKKDRGLTPIEKLEGYDRQINTLQNKITQLEDARREHINRHNLNRK